MHPSRPAGHTRTHTVMGGTSYSSPSSSASSAASTACAGAGAGAVALLSTLMVGGENVVNWNDDWNFGRLPKSPAPPDTAGPGASGKLKLLERVAGASTGPSRVGAAAPPAALSRSRGEGARPCRSPLAAPSASASASVAMASPLSLPAEAWEAKPGKPKRPPPGEASVLLLLLTWYVKPLLLGRLVVAMPLRDLNSSELLVLRAKPSPTALLLLLVELELLALPVAAPKLKAGTLLGATPRLKDGPVPSLLLALPVAAPKLKSSPVPPPLLALLLLLLELLALPVATPRLKDGPVPSLLLALPVAAPKLKSSPVPPPLLALLLLELELLALPVATPRLKDGPVPSLLLALPVDAPKLKAGTLLGATPRLKDGPVPSLLLALPVAAPKLKGGSVPPLLLALLLPVTAGVVPKPKPGVLPPAELLEESKAGRLGQAASPLTMPPERSRLGPRIARLGSVASMGMAASSSRALPPGGKVYALRSGDAGAATSVGAWSLSGPGMQTEVLHRGAAGKGHPSHPGTRKFADFNTPRYKKTQ